jgi:hypothetical protein
MKKLAIVLVILSLLLSGTIIVGSACGSGTCSACGKYICEGNPQWYLQLNADGTFINVSDSFFKGTWKIDGSTITLKPQGPEWLYGGTTSVGTVQGNTLIHAGVRWVKQVEVHEGGGSTSSYSATPQSTPKPTSVTPIITSVSNISATQTQTITIQGEGFGNKEPYRGNSPYIEIIDVTSGLHAGHDANWVEINVAQWTDGQIVISGFTGSYGGPGRSLHVGDQIQINVWNAQSGLGPAVYAVICGSP